MKEIDLEKMVRRQNRRHLLNALEDILNADPNGLGRIFPGITLRDMGETVIIDHNDGGAKFACVAMDSPVEMAFDILKAELHGEYRPYRFKPQEEGADDGKD